MKVRKGFPQVRKVVVVFSALATILFAVMFWSTHNTSRAMIHFFLLVTCIVNVLLWGLLIVSWHFEKVMTSPKPEPSNSAAKIRKKRN